MTAKKTTTTAKKKGRINVRKDPFKPDYRTQIVVQFNEDINLPYEAGVEKHIRDYHVGPWNQLAEKYLGITITPLITSVKPETLKNWISKAKEMDPTYKEGKFFKYYIVTCPVESDSQKIIEELSEWKSVRKTYFSKKTTKPSLFAPDPDYGEQGYLGNSPDGISSLFVWGIDPADGGLAGSDGNSTKFIDIEKGWTLNHEDLGLTAANLLGGGTIDDNSRDHGTSVLGIVGAKVNGTHYVGIAPNSIINVVSSYGTTVANAILTSINYLGFGDVLLIEETNKEVYGGSPDYEVPVETTDPEFDAIRLATALGIIVIEPGGNGNDNGTPANPDDDIPVNFNDFKKNFQEILNPGNPAHFRDSGAVIVTSARSAMCSDAGFEDTHKKLPGAPFGDRVDCYAWGENITTASSDSSGATDQYVNNFGGTSGAAAITAGVVLSMQGMALAEQGYKFSPLQIRGILRDSVNGTPLSRPNDAPPPDNIRENIFMPDLQKFAQNCLNAFPDLYMRDFAGDNGDPHSGSISCSPDIIIKTTPLAGMTPQVAFGEGSPGMDSQNLNDTAIIGQYNYLYARVRNRGGQDAAGAYVKLYYSVPATLITPNLLTPVELRNPVSPFDLVVPNRMTFPGDVLANDELTVTNEYAWIAAQIDSALHYCFVGFVENAEDPTPDLTTLQSMTWDQYRQYIRNNNNITWRNFNMVAMPAPPPVQEPPPAGEPEPEPQPDPEPEPAPGQIPANQLPKKGWLFLDFISPGLPNKKQVMQLEVLSKLPKKTIVMLQMPITWKRDVFRGSPYIRTNLKRRKCYGHINPQGRTKIEKIHFKADSKTPLRLYIFVPDKLRKKKYEIAVRQILEGDEVGRVTWLLVPSKKKK